MSPTSSCAWRRSPRGPEASRGSARPVASSPVPAREDRLDGELAGREGRRVLLADLGERVVHAAPGAVQREPQPLRPEPRVPCQGELGPDDEVLAFGMKRLAGE